jgi:hypothetical protein
MRLKTLTVWATAEEVNLETDNKNIIIHLPKAVITLKEMAVFFRLKNWRN